MVTELALLLGEAGEVTEATLVEEVGAGRWVRAGPRPTAGPQTVRGQLAEPLWLLEVLGLRWRELAQQVGLRSPSRAARSPWRRCMPAPPAPADRRGP
jgi:hypothetical protein